MPRRPQGRFLATVMFTDIVGSTARASEMGDRSWRGLLEAHNAVVRKDLVRFGGREMDTAGDGFFATFDQPAVAIDCACAISEDVRGLGIEVRAAVHTGEVEVIGPKVGGIAVHIGSRIVSVAEPGEVLVSGTVKDLMRGSETRFLDRGLHDLKGVDEAWPLYAVEQVGAGRSARSRRQVWRTVGPDRPRGWIIALGAVVTATLVAGGVLLLSGDGTSPSPGDVALSAAESQLLTLIPEQLRASCQHSPSTSIGAKATVTCTAPTGLKDQAGSRDDYHVSYSNFSNRDDMDAAFEQGLHPVHVPRGDCATDHEARSPYSIGGITTGDVACFITEETTGASIHSPVSSGSSHIAWTDDRVLVYATASRNDLGDYPLYRWWARSAGPIESGSALLPKDVGQVAGASNGFPGFPVGTYAKTIVNMVDADGHWKQVISGADATQGEYKTSRDGSFVEKGYWALGKGREFIIWTPFGACADVGPGIYRFSVRRANGIIVVRFSFVSDACGTSGPVDGTYWSLGPPYRQVA